jgi:hypothetical protein
MLRIKKNFKIPLKRHNSPPNLKSTLSSKLEVRTDSMRNAEHKERRKEILPLEAH